MTEMEWEECDDPQEMISIILQERRISKRKLGLFNVACCRQLWDLIPNERIRAVIDLAERYAEDKVAYEELEAFWDAALDMERHTIDDVILEIIGNLAADQSGSLADEIASRSVMAIGGAAADAVPATRRTDRYEDAAAAAAAEQTYLLRDIFGNPFQQKGIDPVWRLWNHGLILRLAEMIYDTRRYTDMPILADALEDAGCTAAAILDHSRGPGPHTRGCWVVDLILNKT
jgi:hypothetical protein